MPSQLYVCGPIDGTPNFHSTEEPYAKYIGVYDKMTSLPLSLLKEKGADSASVGSGSNFQYLDNKLTYL